jgi:O-antigen/teichoic acid export membrane protein
MWLSQAEYGHKELMSSFDSGITVPEEKAVGVRRVARNTAAILIARVSSLSARLIVTMITARYLGKALFGDYSYVAALVGAFELLSDFGLNQIAIREIARRQEKADDYFGSVLMLKGSMMLLTLAILIVAANSAPGEAHVRVSIYVYGASVILNHFVNTSFVLFRAFERMQYEAVLVLLERALYVLLTVWVISQGAGFVSLFWVNMVSVLVKLALGAWIIATRFTLPKIRLDWAMYKQYLRESLPVGVSQIVNSLILRIDVILLGFLTTSEVVGAFSGPYRIVDTAGLMSVVLITAVFPVMARRARVSRDALRDLLQTAIKALLLLAIPASIGLIILARPALQFVLGGEFTESRAVLQVLALVIIPVYLNRLFDYAFISINRQVAYARITAVALLLNIILDVALIPSIGYWGACVGTVSAEVLRLALCLWLISREVGQLRFWPVVKRIITPGAGMALVLLSLASYSWIVAAIAGALAYLSLVFLGGVLDPKERRALRQVLGTRLGSR